LDDNLAALLSLGCKDNVVTLFPALDDQSLTWEHMRRESGVDLGKTLRVIWAVFLLDDSCTEAVGAQTVENGCLKTAHLRHLWVNVERVPIVAKAVEESLILLSRLFLHKVWVTLRHLRETLSNLAFVSKAANSAHK
jgi:hypothetical protein